MKGEHFHECSQRIEDRGISELIGIARGLVADGVVNELEADFLIRWLKENEHLTCWPFDVLNKRVRAMLADGVIDAEEWQELLELLRDLIGGKPAAGKAVNFASALPLTQPAPDIIFAGKTFCFTGTFAFGQRKDWRRGREAEGDTLRKSKCFYREFRGWKVEPFECSVTGISYSHRGGQR